MKQNLTTLAFLAMTTFAFSSDLILPDKTPFYVKSHQDWYWFPNNYQREERAKITVVGPNSKIDDYSAWFGPGATLKLWGRVLYDEQDNGSNDFTVYGVTRTRVGDTTIALAGSDTVVRLQQTYWSAGWQNATSANFTLKYDGTPPEYSLVSTPESSATNWSRMGTFQVIIAGLADTKSGLASVSYQLDGGSSNIFAPGATGTGTNNTSYANNVITVTGLSNGAHSFIVTATDKVGNVSAAQTISLYVDSLVPVISVAPVSLSKWYGPLGNGGTTWSISTTGQVATSKYQVGYSATLPTAAVTPANFGSLVQLNSGTIGTSVGVSPAVAGDGYYYILATAANTAGSPAIPVVSGPYMYSASPPAFGAPGAGFVTGGGVNVSWTGATVNTSGYAYPAPYSPTYTVSYSNDGTNYTTAPQSITQPQTGNYLLQFPIGSNYGKTLSFKVTGTDAVGNQASKVVTVPVPPVLTISAANFASGNTSQAMEVDIQFGSPSGVVMTPALVKSSFQSITITRANQLAGSSVALSDLVLDTSTIQLDAQGKLVANSTWKLASDGQSLVYVDLVPVSSGAGHKKWLYGLAPTPWYGGVSSSSVVTLPNNKGSVGLRLIDRNRVALGSSGFGVGATGNFAAEFVGKDPDLDSWTYEVDTISQFSAAGVVNQKLSGETPVNYPSTAGSNLNTIPISLALGDNNICVIWNEGDPNDSSLTFRTYYANIRLTSDGNGGVKVWTGDTLGNLVPAARSVILTTPGESIQLTMPATSPAGSQMTYAWDFGDWTSPDLVDRFSLPVSWSQTQGG